MGSKKTPVGVCLPRNLFAEFVTGLQASHQALRGAPCHVALGVGQLVHPATLDRGVNCALLGVGHFVLAVLVVCHAISIAQKSIKHN